MNDQLLVDRLNDVSLHFNRYFSIFILLFGTIGNVLNCFVLAQPSLRINPCAYLFLMSSIANTISIIVGLTTRILSGWNMDLSSTHLITCKIRVFIMLSSRTVAFWLIALATIDRWLSLCNRYQRRQMSSLKNSQRGTICIALFSILIYCQVLYCYDINMTLAPLRCYGKTIACRLLTDVSYAGVTIVCPLLLMTIFGFMTISNIRATYSVILSERHRLERASRKHKTLSLTLAQRQRWKRIDRYLRHVLFVQIVLLTILTLPQAIEKLYTTLTITSHKSPIHIAIDKFIYNIALLLTYCASGMPFYIYTLNGGDMFRTAFVNSLRTIMGKLTCCGNK